MASHRRDADMSTSRSISPEILKPRWRQLGVSDGVLDVLVPQVVLDRPCVVAVPCELVAGSMA